MTAWVNSVSVTKLPPMERMGVVIILPPVEAFRCPWCDGVGRMFVVGVQPA